MARAAARRRTDATGCQTRVEWPFWYRGASRPADSSPRCRRAQRKVVDAPLFNRRAYSPKAKCLGSTCIAGAGNARIEVADIDRGMTPIAIRDSNGNPFAGIKQTTRGCFTVYDRTTAGAYVAVGDTNPTGCADRLGNGGSYRVGIDVQGRACMASSALETSNYLIRLNRPKAIREDPRYKAGPYPNYTGINGPQARVDLLQGFVSRDVLRGLSAREKDRAEKAYPGCGRRPALKRLSSEVIELGTLRKFAAADKYQSPFAAERACSNEPHDAGCGAPYANYQGLSFASEVVMLASSTTGVSGLRSRGEGPGGVVRAVLPRSETFRKLDFTGQQRATSDPLRGYVDPNVPCGQQRMGSWYFGRTTLGGRQLLGWIAEKVATPLSAHPASTPNSRGPCT